MQQPRNFSSMTFFLVTAWSLAIFFIGMWIGRAGIPLRSGEGHHSGLSTSANAVISPVSHSTSDGASGGPFLLGERPRRAAASQTHEKARVCKPVEPTLEALARRAGIAIERLAYMRRVDARKLLAAVKPVCGCGQSLGQCLLASPRCQQYQQATSALLTRLQQGASNELAAAKARRIADATQAKATTTTSLRALRGTTSHPLPKPELAVSGRQPNVSSGGASVVRIGVDGAPTLGPTTAPLTVVVFVDLVDQGRRGLLLSLRHLRLRYGHQNVRIVFRHFPLSGRALSSLAAEASMCAFGQGRFWPYMEKLLRHRGALAHNHLIGYAKGLKFDLTRFERELSKGRYRPAVKRDLSTALRLRLPGAPYVFINGWPVAPRHHMNAVAARAWRRAQRLLAQGVAPARLYDVLTQRGKQTL